jgi:hypothetical protein
MRERTFTTMLSIALRNLSRHRVKTIITATAVAVSVCLYIAADGWLHGMNLESRRNIVSYEIGAAKIQTKAYFEKKDDLPMYEAFSGWEGLSESLSRAGYDSAPRFVFSEHCTPVPGRLPSSSTAWTPSGRLAFCAIPPTWNRDDTLFRELPR